MKAASLILALAALTLHLQAEDEVPVPPEIQALSEAFVAALKSGDQAALAACWHTPEILAKLAETEAAAQATTSPTPLDPAKENERELRRQTKNLATTQYRAGKIRELFAKYFGDLTTATLLRVELDLDNNAATDSPGYEEIDIHLTSADGTELKVEIDEVVRIGDAWKFRGRLDHELTIEIPAEP